MAYSSRRRRGIREPALSRRRLRSILLISIGPVLLIALGLAWYLNQDVMRHSLSGQAVSAMSLASSYRAVGADLTVDSSGTREVHEEFSYIAPDQIRSRYRTTVRSTGSSAMVAGGGLIPSGCVDTEIVVLGSRAYRLCNDEGPDATWEIFHADPSIFQSLQFQPWRRLKWCTNIQEERVPGLDGDDTRVLSCVVPNEREAEFAFGEDSTADRERFISEADIRITAWVREGDLCISRFMMEETAPGAAGEISQTLDYAYSDFDSVPPIESPDDSGLQNPTSTTDGNGGPEPQLAFIDGQMFELEVAGDEPSRRKGLSNRPSLAEDAAMLFVFPTEGAYSFWMKDVLIPLDILFLDKNGKIVSIQTMRVELGRPDSELERYSPPVPVLYALEIDGGLADKRGFEVGTVVELY